MTGANRRLVRLSWPVILGALMLAVTACGAVEGGGTPSSTPTPGPSERFQGVESLDSYRYTLAIRAAGSILDQSEAPAGLDLENETLTVDIEGYWTSPGNEYQSANIRFGVLAVRQDSITMDGRLWTSVEGGPWAERESLTGPEEFLGQDIPLSPNSILGNSGDEMLERLTADLNGRPHDAQVLNGRQSIHWSLGQDWFDTFAADFAEILAGVSRDRGMDLTIDLWADVETGVGSKLEVRGTFPGDAEPSILMKMELFDINSPEIKVEQPAGAIDR